MAHGHGGGGHEGGAGIESLAPPIGQITVLLTSAGVFGVFWIIVKQPKIVTPACILSILIVGCCLIPQVFDPVAGWFAGLAAIIGGMCLAGSHN